MTTYELPPEPAIGARVRDHHGHVWTHTNDGWSHPELRSSGLSWGAVMAYASPAELIEPDPWPTHELIVASIGERREVLARNEGGGYESPITSAWKGGPALTNVVPVTVVPAAALPVLWSALEQWLNGHSDPDAATNKLVGAVVGLREQIDALELDQ